MTDGPHDDGSDELRNLLSEVAEEESFYGLPNSTIRVLQRENVDVYIFPAIAGDGHRYMIAHPYEFGAALAGLLDEEMSPQPDQIGVHLDWGAYQIFPFVEVSEIRDRYECVRDRIRHSEGQSRPIEPDLDALQEIIDALVVVERAVAHIRSCDGDDRVRHYHRMSALGEDPEAVITAVQQAIEPQSEPAGLFDRFRTAVGAGERDR